MKFRSPIDASELAEVNVLPDLKRTKELCSSNFRGGVAGDTDNASMIALVATRLDARVICSLAREGNSESLSHFI